MIIETDGGEFSVTDRASGERSKVKGVVVTVAGKKLLGIHATTIDGRAGYAITHIATAAFVVGLEWLGEATAIARMIISEVKPDAWPMAWSKNRLAASEYLREPILLALLDCRCDYFFRGRWKSTPRTKEAET